MSGFAYVSGPRVIVHAVVPASDTVGTFIGDPMAYGAAGESVDYMPLAAPCGAGAGILGICVGFEPSRDYEGQKHRTLSTKRIAQILLALPGTIFKVKSDAAMLVSEVGLLFDHQSGAGSTTTGHSGYVLDNSGTGATGSGQWRFVGVLRDTDNMNVNSTPAYVDKDASTTNVWCLVMAAETYVGIGTVGT
jgi:hypothetical protein